MMRSTFRKWIIPAMGFAVMSIAAMTLTTPEARALGARPTLEGVWQVTRMGVNCQTGRPGPSSFPAIMQFFRDGNYRGYAVSPGSTPANGADEFGTWRRDPGRQNYSLRFLGYGYDDSGAFDGRGEITIQLELAADGNAFDYTSTIGFFDANGNLLVTFCGKASGTRFE